MPNLHSTSSRLVRSVRAWPDRGWPVLAGSLLALGLIGIHLTQRPAALVLVPTIVWCVSAALLYGVMRDCGLSVRTVLRSASVTTAVVTTVVGLILLHPLWGGVAAAVATVTSPPVTDRTAPALRRTKRRGQQIGGDRPSAQPRATTELDRAEVDLIFEHLVKELEHED